MRIMQLMGGGDVGGAKTHIMSLVKALGERHEVMLVSFREGPFAEEAKEEGIRVEVLPTINLVRVRQQLLALVDQFHPDVIHCHGSRANLMGALIRAKRRIPIVTTVHSDYKLDYLGAPLKQHTLGNMNAIALRFLDYYQPVADRMAQTLIRRGFNPERLFVIYNGMDFSEKVTNFDRAAYCREKWGIEIDEKDILCGIAARLTAVKDIGTLLRALQIALREAPQLRLFIAGEGEDGEMLKKLAHSLGIESRVVFCGWVNPIDRFYAAMDLMYIQRRPLPSSYDAVDRSWTFPCHRLYLSALSLRLSHTHCQAHHSYPPQATAHGRHRNLSLLSGQTDCRAYAQS